MTNECRECDTKKAQNRWEMQEKCVNSDSCAMFNIPQAQIVVNADDIHEANRLIKQLPKNLDRAIAIVAAVAEMLDVISAAAL